MSVDWRRATIATPLGCPQVTPTWQTPTVALAVLQASLLPESSSARAAPPAANAATAAVAARRPVALRLKPVIRTPKHPLAAALVALHGSGFRLAWQKQGGGLYTRL